MIRILHTGDIHLGDLNGPIRDGKNARREDTLACMSYIVDKAKEQGPHISIIAGDLFNRSRVWADTALDDVNEAISAFLRPLCEASEQVVLLFGTSNHDNPRAFDTLVELTKDLKNLHIYTKPQVDRLSTSEGAIQIVALPGFDKGRLRLFYPNADKETENRNATALINDVLLGLSTQVDPYVPSVLVAHYTVAGSEADNGSTFMAGQDVVILPSTIDSTGVTLGCFGHIHRPQKLLCNTPAYYCGSPNQLTFNDEGTKHGFYFHELDTMLGKYGVRKSTFIHTPERQHYTYRMGQDEVEAFTQKGELNPPSPTGDAIVRVRYSCSQEQEKALNKAELQKKLLAAGAFFVSEVIPEDIEDTVGEISVTEHEGPTEALTRYLDKLGFEPEEKARLMDLAAPLIKKADDGRDADKRTGSFSPISIQVKNYRSYVEASFDFEPVHMAMVNGQNGVGKSSLFMDAIADCLYEQTRKEDVGGWVRDGTKSGAITFTFGMGAETYRVIRTRTKSGRGTLALHRKDTESGEWKDESDTTMKLTQARIERVLGMDCNTFCSVALIRQDAYGLFLEASSDRRMEVLSALLGLDIYGRLEAMAKEAASDQRKQMAATQERLSVLEETISTKGKLAEDLRQYDIQIAEANTEADRLDASIADAQRSEAMREELQRQLSSRNAEINRTREEAAHKVDELAASKEQYTQAVAEAFGLKEAEAAASEAKQLQKKVEDLEPKEEAYKALLQQISSLEREMNTAKSESESYQSKISQLQEIMSQRTKILAAKQQMEALATRRTEAENRFQTYRRAHQTALEAKADRDAQSTKAKAEIYRMDSNIEFYSKQASRLKNSRCPVPERAMCAFLEDAVAAKGKMEEAMASRNRYWEQARNEYTSLNEHFKAAKEAFLALKDPTAELEEIKAEEAKYRDMASLEPKLAAAEAQAEELRLRTEESQAKATACAEELEAVYNEISSLKESHMAIAEAKIGLKEANAKAESLPRAKAAMATAEALTPRIAALENEVEQLRAKAEELAEERDRLAVAIQPITADLNGLTAQRKAVASLMSTLSASKGGVQAKLDAVAEAEAQAKDYREQITSIARKLNDYQVLYQAFGLDGIQYMIVKGVVPEITHRANDILYSMTGGRMAVDIRTEKEQKSTKQIVNSLEVWINSLSGGSRPYQSHSGGEKVKISLAVTLGLADIKARRAGVQLGMLFIDEPPFLDSDGTEAYADALASMAARNPSMRILAISHDPTMVARFPQSIRVESGENGSTVRMD